MNREDRNFFAENGFLQWEGVFSPEEVAAMRREADYILELILNSSLAHQRLSKRLDWRVNSQGAQIVRKIQPINDLSLLFTRVAKDERIVRPLREMMGEEPVLMEEKLNYKQPLPASVEGLPIRELDDCFPVHNDWAYYKAQNYPRTILSSALLIDDCTPHNGPLRIWPGSHKFHREHYAMENGLQVKPDSIDFDGGREILAPAGSFLIFHTLLVHNSKPNLSGRSRRLMIYSHYPESFSMPYDVRNGPARLRESPWEREYARMKLRGEFEDRFSAPAYS